MMRAITSGIKNFFRGHKNKVNKQPTQRRHERVTLIPQQSKPQGNFITRATSHKRTKLPSKSIPQYPGSRFRALRDMPKGRTAA